jgi:hypothetical protein
VRVGDRWLGVGEPVFVIAEIGINHNGSIEIAKRLIDVAKSSGCDAVKFQLFRVEEVFAPEILNRSEKHRARKNWELPGGFIAPIAERCAWQLAALLPHHDRAYCNRDHESDAELVDDVIGRSRISGERREDRLNKKIVASMQNRRRPKTSRAQRQPREDKTVGYHHKRETGQAVPGGRACVVISKKQNRKMVNGPHQSANETHSREFDHLRQFRHEEAAPANLFPDRPRCFADKPKRRRQENEQGEREAGRKT